MITFFFILVITLFPSLIFSFTPCPFLGPAYPPFRLDSNATIIATALENLKAAFDELMSVGGGSHGEVTPNTTSFSIALFSTNEGTASSVPFFFDYHYTAPSLIKSKSGVTEVNVNSIYRIGGLTEVFTIWTILTEVGDGIWTDLATKYVPELWDAAQKSSMDGNPITSVSWTSITIGELASHMSGISRDYGINEISKQVANPEVYGFPEIEEPIPACFLSSECDRTEFFANFIQQPPVVLSGTTPAYSNEAFQILGYVVENITGEPFEFVLQSRLLTPLKMNQSSLSTPPNSDLSVIPGSETASGWNTKYGDEAPAISMFSSVRDLAIAGKGILASTLLAQADTNRWLKPVSHTSNPANSVSLPWTVYSQGSYPNTSMVDVYTAFDNFGLYSSYLGLVPDYNVGFAILAADTVSNPDLNAHADIIGDIIFKALIETAIINANATFAGLYSTSSSSGGINSSIIVSADELPGLFISSFISNGTDFRNVLATLYNVDKVDALSIRLYPTHLITKTESGSKQAFRAVYQDQNEFADSGTPTCVSWMDVDKFKYGGAALDLFIFELNSDDEVIGVEIPALRVELEKMT